VYDKRPDSSQETQRGQNATPVATASGSIPRCVLCLLDTCGTAEHPARASGGMTVVDLDAVTWDKVHGGQCPIRTRDERHRQRRTS
jgi:hypothetical protein